MINRNLNTTIYILNIHDRNLSGYSPSHFLIRTWDRQWYGYDHVTPIHLTFYRGTFVINSATHPSRSCELDNYLDYLGTTNQALLLSVVLNFGKKGLHLLLNGSAVKQILAPVPRLLYGVMVKASGTPVRQDLDAIRRPTYP